MTTPRPDRAAFDAKVVKLKELLQAKTAFDDDAVVELRSSLKADCLRLLQAGADDVDESLWKLCFHRRIDDFRKRIGALGPGAAQKRLIGEYLQFLNEARDYFDRAFTQLIPQGSPKVLHRLALYMGDVLRYREMVSDVGQKRFKDAEKWYLRASKLDPLAGAPHNQLAVLASLNQMDLSVVYRYERAMAIARPFQMAKVNLKATLEAVVASKPVTDVAVPRVVVGQPLSTAERSALRTDFTWRFVRQHATMMLPSAEALFDMPDLEPSLVRVMATAGFREGSEALTAVAGMAIFAVSNFDALGRDTRHEHAFAVLDTVTRAFATHAASCMDDLARLARALVPLSMCCDAAPLQCLTPATREALTRMSRVLTTLGTQFVSKVKVPDAETDLASFTPLQRVAHPCDVSKIVQEAHNESGFFLQQRIGSVSNVAAQIAAQETAAYSRFAVDGNVQRAEVDDEDILLFRPTFSRLDSTATEATDEGSAVLPVPSAAAWSYALPKLGGVASGDWLSQVGWGFDAPLPAAGAASAAAAAAAPILAGARPEVKKSPPPGFG